MNQVMVTQKENYFSLITTHPQPKGSVLLKLEGTLSPSPNRYSVQLGEKEHVSDGNQKQVFMYLNHSCQPTTFFDIEKRELIALRDMKAEEEMTYNYNTTEFEIQFPFLCHCKHPQCIGEVKGFGHLSLPQQIELERYLSPYLKTLLPACV
jgi:hypothetical protein